MGERTTRGYFDPSTTNDEENTTFSMREGTETRNEIPNGRQTLQGVSRSSLYKGRDLLSGVHSEDDSSGRQSENGTPRNREPFSE